MTGLLKPSSALKSDRYGGLVICQFSKPGYEVSQNLSFHVCKVGKNPPGLLGWLDVTADAELVTRWKGSQATGRDFARPVLRLLVHPAAGGVDHLEQPQGKNLVNCARCWMLTYCNFTIYIYVIILYMLIQCYMPIRSQNQKKMGSIPYKYIKTKGPDYLILLNTFYAKKENQ